MRLDCAQITDLMIENNANPILGIENTIQLDKSALTQTSHYSSKIIPKQIACNSLCWPFC